MARVLESLLITLARFAYLPGLEVWDHALRIWTGIPCKRNGSLPS